jgi:quinol monooxygenase YgiN
MFFSAALDRRRLLQGWLAVLLSALFAPIARAEKAAVRRPIVRISRGSFAPDSHDQIRQRLDAARESLIPAIRQLEGCLHYFAAIDRESSSMVNVSVWRSLADAQQMQTLAPMLALADAFTREGVRFERPVINYETVWEIDR